jgi:hypothetical protein
VSAAKARRAEPVQNRARVLSVIAVASIAAGAINAAAAATVGRGSAQNLAFFGVVAAAQLVWGAVALARAPRWWLALSAVGNVLVVATWVVSRSVGLPFGEFAGLTLPVGFPDGLATILEAVTVVGAVGLLVRDHGPSRSAARSPGFAVAAAALIGTLGLVGVLSQADALSSGGPAGNGDGGQVRPAAPGDAGGPAGGGFGY